MRRRSTLHPLAVLLLASTLSLILLACAEPAQPDADQLAQEAALAEERSAFQRRFKADLAAVDQAAETLEAQVEEASEETQAHLAKRVEKLYEERAALYRELDELASVSDSMYRSLRPALERRYDELSDDLVDVRLAAPETWEAFQQVAEARLHELDRRLQALERDVAPLDEATVVGDSIRHGALREQHEQLLDQLAGQPPSSAEAFRQAKHTLIEQISALNEAMRSAERRAERAVAPST